MSSKVYVLQEVSQNINDYVQKSKFVSSFLRSDNFKGAGRLSNNYGNFLLPILDAQLSYSCMGDKKRFGLGEPRAYSRSKSSPSFFRAAIDPHFASKRFSSSAQSCIVGESTIEKDIAYFFFFVEGGVTGGESYPSPPPTESDEVEVALLLLTAVPAPSSGSGRSVDVASPVYVLLVYASPTAGCAYGHGHEESPHSHVAAAVAHTHFASTSLAS